MPHSKDRNQNSAFTLIELLVVIAIIAILAAILFPVFAQARSKARQITGTSNAKQASLAILMYMQDYDETFVRAGWDCQTHDSPNAQDIPPGIENACGATTWGNVTQPYTKNGGIFVSPGDGSTSNVLVLPDDGHYSLLINDLLSHQMPTTPQGYADPNNQGHFASGLSLASAVAPADCVLLMEGRCGWDKIDGQGVTNSAAAHGPDWTGSFDVNNKWHKEHTMSGFQTFLVAGKSYGDWGQRNPGVPFYTGGANVAFTDGHVKYIRTVDGNGNPIICGSLKWTQHVDPQQRNADKDGCGDPNNPPGYSAVANWN